MEYYMGLNPEIDDDESEFSILPGESFSTLIFRRSKSATGVTLRILYSEDGMSTWNPTGYTMSVIEDQPTWERVGAEVPMGFKNKDRIFFQLEASR